MSSVVQIDSALLIALPYTVPPSQGVVFFVSSPVDWVMSMFNMTVEDVREEEPATPSSDLEHRLRLEAMLGRIFQKLNDIEASQKYVLESVDRACHCQSMSSNEPGLPRSDSILHDPNPNPSLDANDSGGLAKARESVWLSPRHLCNSQRPAQPVPREQRPHASPFQAPGHNPEKCGGDINNAEIERWLLEPVPPEPMWCGKTGVILPDKPWKQVYGGQTRIGGGSSNPPGDDPEAPTALPPPRPCPGWKPPSLTFRSLH